MDILAGVLAYVAGIGALFAALAVSLFVFFSTPHEPAQTATQPQSASAMLVRPSTSKPSARNKRAALETRAKQSATQSASHSEASARDARRKQAASAAQARRLIQEERARRWAYQQGSSFEGRFLGYAD